MQKGKSVGALRRRTGRNLARIRNEETSRVQPRLEADDIRPKRGSTYYASLFVPATELQPSLAHQAGIRLVLVGQKGRRERSEDKEGRGTEKEGVLAKARRGGDAEGGDEEGEVCVAGRSPFLYGLARGWFGPPLHNRRARLPAPRPRPPCWYRSVRQPWFKIFTVKVPRSSIDGYAMPRIMECLFRFTRVSRSRLYLTSKRSFLKNEQYFFQDLSFQNFWSNRNVKINARKFSCQLI